MSLFRVNERDYKSRHACGKQQCIRSSTKTVTAKEMQPLRFKFTVVFVLFCSKIEELLPN